MKLIAITGLAGLEKGRLTLDLAEHFAQNGQVSIIDNGENNPLDSSRSAFPIMRIDGDLAPELASQLARLAMLGVDVALLNVAESLNPEHLFAILENSVAGMEAFRMDDVRVVALIDDRTCNCFPHLHDLLESYADVTLRYPFTLQEALARL